MAQVTTQTTYDDNAGVIQKRVITDYITLIDPADTPFVEAMGGLDGGAKKFRFVNFPHTKVEWIEDTREPLTVGLNTAMNTVVTTAVLLAASANMVQVGQILKFADGSEQMWVSAIASDGITLTVTRAYGGTTATSQVVANNTAIEILGVARLEGAESTGLGYTVRSTNYNHTQIMQREIKVSRSQNQISQYGIREEFDYQSNKAIPHLMRLVEKAVYNGYRAAGSSAVPRSFGGLGTFVTDNAINSGSAAVTQAKFENALKAAYVDGGKPTKAFVSPTNMQVIKNFYDSANFLRVDTKEKSVGMTIEKIITPYGNIDLIMDRWASNATIYILDPEHVGFVTYYPFTSEPLAKTGDYQRGEVVGEFTLCVRMDKAHAVITTIA
jgi:hypothetical protein